MNPQQKQMLNMMYASTAKTEEELNKMTPEEKKEYLRSRLQQKMNIGGLQRRTNFQKTQIQEKLQANTEEVKVEGEEAGEGAYEETFGTFTESKWKTSRCKKIRI
jgi:ribosome-binding ATPase YchF (GTP1/OBG family)